jgi:hypothetical protein
MQPDHDHGPDCGCWTCIYEWHLQVLRDCAAWRVREQLPEEEAPHVAA